MKLDFSQGGSGLLRQPTNTEVLKRAGIDALASSKDPEKLIRSLGGKVRIPRHQHNITFRDVVEGRYSRSIDAVLDAVYSLGDDEVLVIGANDLSTPKYSANRNRNTNRDAFVNLNSSLIMGPALGTDRFNKYDLVKEQMTVGRLFATFLQTTHRDMDGPPLNGYRWSNQGVELATLARGLLQRGLSNHVGYFDAMRESLDIIQSPQSSQAQRREAKSKFRRNQISSERYDSRSIVDLLLKEGIDPRIALIQETEHKDFGLSDKKAYLQGLFTEQLTKKVLYVPRFSDYEQRQEVVLENLPAASLEHAGAMFSWQFNYDFSAGDIIGPKFQGHDVSAGKHYRHAPSEVVAAWHTVRNILSHRKELEVYGNDNRRIIPNTFRMVDSAYLAPTSSTMRVFDKGYKQVLKLTFDEKKPLWKLDVLNMQDISSLLGYHTLANKKHPEATWHVSAAHMDEDNPMNYVITR